jgi:hypothetical protein
VPWPAALVRDEDVQDRFFTARAIRGLLPWDLIPPLDRNHSVGGCHRIAESCTQNGTDA